MFGLLTNLLARRPAKSDYSYRPGVESLEDRWCPDASHITCTAVVQPGHVVQLTGSVTGDQVAGINVQFSGAVFGSTTTDGNGHYTYTTSNATLGTLTAVGTNSFLLPITDTAQAIIAVDNPTLTLNIASVSRNMVTLTGHLTDIDAAGRPVQIMGVAMGTAITDNNGDFALTTTASALGSITAHATNLWMRWGTSPPVSVTSYVPVIESFLAVHGAGDTWTFSGHVADEDAAGLTIRFAGLTSLMGQTVVVDENGNFSFTGSISEDDLDGTVTAITTDWWGLNSGLANYSLS